MRLTVYNGSPRGRESNTSLLLEHLLQGYEATAGNSHELYHLRYPTEAAQATQTFGRAECVLLAFPLYTDAMPGRVMAFIEGLAPYVGRPGNSPLAFMVHSGFPESAHSRPVQAYLERLAGRLGSAYVGTIVKGGSEGIRDATEKQTRQLYGRLEAIGRSWGATGRLDAEQLRALAAPECLPAFTVPIFRLLVRCGVFDSGWNQKLKANGAFAERFARRYAG